MATKTKLKTTRFDAAEYLTTPEHIAEYLKAVLEDSPDDVGAMIAALKTVARAQGMTELAERSGVPRTGIYKALAEDANPGFATIAKIMSGLGVRFSVEART
jgi:probable addiction module antidote protein